MGVSPLYRELENYGELGAIAENVIDHALHGESIDQDQVKQDVLEAFTSPVYSKFEKYGDLGALAGNVIGKAVRGEGIDSNQVTQDVLVSLVSPMYSQFEQYGQLGAVAESVVDQVAQSGSVDTKQVAQDTMNAFHHAAKDSMVRLANTHILDGIQNDFIQNIASTVVSQGAGAVASQVFGPAQNREIDAVIMI